MQNAHFFPAGTGCQNNIRLTLDPNVRQTLHFGQYFTYLTILVTQPKNNKLTVFVKLDVELTLNFGHMTSIEIESNINVL